MHAFFSANWQRILEHNQLANFDAFWSLTTPWFEEPNMRRGGWSGVTKVIVKIDNNQQQTLFVKRQENHSSRTWLHPIKGLATFEKEFHNLQRFHHYDIPTLTPVYFASREVAGNRQAILVTEELKGYLPLDAPELLNDSRTVSLSKQRRLLLRAVACVARKMHQHHLQHNCFYPKHIFVKKQQDSWSVKIIDLEKTKRTLTQRAAVIRDLATLLRHSPDTPLKEQIYFLKAYLGEQKLTNSSRQLIKAIQSTIAAKKGRH